MLTCLKLYANLDAAATGDAKVSIDMPADGTIECIDWAVTGVDAAVIAARVELGLGSSSTLTQNDSRSSISQVAVANTAAAAGVAINKHVHFSDAVQVLGGERLYLHLNNDTAGAFDTLRVTCFIYAKLKGEGGGRTRRL